MISLNGRIYATNLRTQRNDLSDQSHHLARKRRVIHHRQYFDSKMGTQRVSSMLVLVEVFCIPEESSLLHSDTHRLNNVDRPLIIVKPYTHPHNKSSHH